MTDPAFPTASFAPFDCTDLPAPRDPARAFEVLCKVAPAGIWQTDADGGATFANRHFFELTGLETNRWKGPEWAKALHPGDRDRVWESWHRAVENRTNFRDTWRWLHADGRIVWVETLAAPDIGEDGEVKGFVGINIDITSMKDGEEELRSARIRAENATRAKSTFLANMSHEIRTPMNGVLGFTELMLAGDLPPNQRRYAQMIADSGQAMMQLLNDILDMAKIEAGQLDLHVGPVELGHKLRRCLQLIEGIAERKGLKLTLDIDPALPSSFETDPLRFRQIVFNLLGNAAKFTESGEVRLSARRVDDGRGIAIAVSDTGSGIAPQQQDHIFQQFTQADGTIARKYGGTGLGLAITRQLVDMLDGSIVLQSELGVGSTFTVTLPLRERDRLQLVECEPADADAVMDARSSEHQKPNRVLVAEDHDINQMLILGMLEQCGFAADLAENGEQAVDMALSARDAGAPYDIVLMDVQMPVLNGLDAARQLRSAGVTEQDLPILALTANCYADDIASCLAAGMQGHLPKPLKMAQLVEALSRHLVSGDHAKAA